MQSTVTHGQCDDLKKHKFFNHSKDGDASMRETSAPFRQMKRSRLNSWCVCSSIHYSPRELSRATELLSRLMYLQPLLFGLAEELLSVSLELNVDRLQEVMHSIRQQVRMELKERDPLIHFCICSHPHAYTCGCMPGSVLDLPAGFGLAGSRSDWLS